MVRFAFWPDWYIEDEKRDYIGGGSFGRVYKIRRDDNGLQAVSALKVIRVPQDDAEVDELRDRSMDDRSIAAYYDQTAQGIVSEIRLLLTLKYCPNIVRIEDYHVERNADGFGCTVYIRMPLLDSLEDRARARFKAGNLFTPEEVVKIGSDVCDALTACETRNIIHRDIKPANIFIDESGTYILGDFGIARQADSATQSMHSQKGTMNYMAPEIMRGEKGYDRTVDIYSLGTMLYRYLNHNRFPYEPRYPQPISPADSSLVLMQRLNGAEVPLPDGGPAALGQAVCRACAADPRARYQRAAEMKEALQQGLKGVAADPAGDAFFGAASADERTVATGTPVPTGIPEAPAAGDHTVGAVGNDLWLAEQKRLEEERRREEQQRLEEQRREEARQLEEQRQKELEEQQRLAEEQARQSEKKARPSAGKKPQKKATTILGILLGLLMIAAAFLFVYIKTHPAPLTAPVEAVALGYEHGAAIRSDGSLWMWGNNGSGEIGSGSDDWNQEVPLRVMRGVQSVSLGSFHSAALKKDGSLWTWGSHQYGLLGDGATEVRNKPARIMQDVQQVVAGYDVMAAIQADGSLWMWGSNDKGQLGDGTTVDRSSPVRVLDDVRSVSMAYEDYAAAIRTDGSLWMWGSNEYGQLGDGTTVDRPEPVLVMEDVQSVSIDYWSSAAVRTDGTLWTWGVGWDGILGDGTRKERSEPVMVMEDVAFACIENGIGAAIKTDGSLWMWGNNNGWLGDGTTEDRYEPVMVMEDVASVSMHSACTAAIKTDGSLWMWGRNDNGRLGNGTTEDRYEPVMILEDVASVALEYTHCAAVKKDGSLWTWGENSDHCLGDGTMETRLTPVCITEKE